MARSKKELIQILASKYNLPLKIVDDIVDSQFKYVVKIMKEGNFDAIRLPYFGRFSAKKGRIECVNKLKKKSDGSTDDK